MTSRNIARLGAASLAGALLSAALIGCAPASQLEGDQLDLLLDYTPGANHTAIYWAQDKGAFAEQDLTVEITPPADASSPLKLLSAGQVDLAVSYEGQVDLSAAEGLNVKAVGWIVPVPLASLIAKADGTVAGVEDLRGKTVGWPGIPSFGAMTEAVLEHADIPENEVELVNVGYNLVQSVMSGQVDAIIGGFRNSEAVNLAEVSGTEPVVIPVDQLGVPSYNELVFVADGARLADDADYRDRVQRFLAAYYSALDEVQADPDQAIEVLSNYMEASRENVTSAVRMTVGLMKPPNGLPAGCISTEQWGAFADWMAEHELISRAPSPEQTLDLSLLPEDCA